MIYVVHGKKAYYGGITISDKLKLFSWNVGLEFKVRTNPVPNKVHIDWVVDTDKNDKRIGRKPFIYIPADKDISDYHNLITELCIKYDLEYWGELPESITSRLDEIGSNYHKCMYFEIDVPLMMLNLHDLNVGLQKRGIKKGNFSVTHFDGRLCVVIKQKAETR